MARKVFILFSLDISTECEDVVHGREEVREVGQEAGSVWCTELFFFFFIITLKPRAE